MGPDSRKRSRVVGVLIGDVSFDFSAELMAGISGTAAEADMRVVFLLGMQRYAEDFEGSACKAVAVSHNGVYDYAGLIGADAFIIACGSLSGFSGGGLDQRFLSRFSGVPYVVLQERIAADNRKKTYIVVDNYRSFSQCVEHLIVQHGYRRIALVSGPRGHADARERMRAYLDCMRRHELPVPDGMIADGDYSEYVDDLVSGLIDRNPGLEAIVFANDEMAKAGYRECRRRGLVVGRDIAITGFDNFNAGRTMEPPLTTVSQDTYQMGRLAVERVTAMLDGREAPPLEMRTEFLARQSCGCARRSFRIAVPAGAEAAAQIDAVIDEIVGGYAGHFAMDKREAHAADLRGCFLALREIALRSPRGPVDYNELAGRLDAVFSPFDQPTLLLGQCLQDFLLQFPGTGEFPPQVVTFIAAVSYMQQYMHSREVGVLDGRLETYRSQSWIAPELTRGLFGETDEQTVYRRVVRRLVRMGLNNVYICLMENEDCSRGARGGEVVHRLRLAACADAESDTAYPPAERPLVDAEHPFWQMPGYAQLHAVMAFSMFSGDQHFGVLLCDEDRQKSPLLHVIGLQLGMLIDFLALREQERKISAELENIREKNEILNFLSEYDSLTGLLNRRGFIERAIRRNRENIGKTAYCAYMDLDYLKQINDTFGHSEGDAALIGLSALLKGIAGDSGLIGRIGGDEFAGLFITEDPEFEARFLHAFEAQNTQYNQASAQPYRLEVSIGLAHFTCRQGLEVSSVLAAADKYLYAPSAAAPPTG
jgi:diguanylate cyclase (GGDEF)-like protein